MLIGKACLRGALECSMISALVSRLLNYVRPLSAGARHSPWRRGGTWERRCCHPLSPTSVNDMNANMESFWNVLVRQIWALSALLFGPLFGDDDGVPVHGASRAGVPDGERREGPTDGADRSFPISSERKWPVEGKGGPRGADSHRGQRGFREGGGRREICVFEGWRQRGVGDACGHRRPRSRWVQR